MRAGAGDTITEDADGFVCGTGIGVALRMEQTTVAVPIDRLRNAMADAAKWWPGAAEVSTHRAVIAVAAASAATPGASLGQTHAQATAAVVDLALARGAAVLGVLWNGERLYPAEFVQAHAPMNPALGLLVGFHAPASNPETSLYTTGLSVLGLRNIEAEATDDLNATARMMQHMVLYLLKLGDVVGDGDTIGYSAAHDIAGREREASWGGERVSRLRLTAAGEHATDHEGC